MQVSLSLPFLQCPSELIEAYFQVSVPKISQEVLFAIILSGFSAYLIANVLRIVLIL